MNIIAICGSPRKGNTEFVLKRFLTQAEGFGHKTELVLLREKRVNHCKGCFGCEDDGVCNLLDDMKLTIDRLLANDVIVFGSPNYFNNVSGMMKAFIDRLRPLYYQENRLKGKKAVMIFVGDDSVDSEKAIATVRSVVDLLKMDNIGDLYLKASKPQDMESSAENIKNIDEFAKNLLG
jgi:multimeric flavodoxin WrbA